MNDNDRKKSVFHDFRTLAPAYAAKGLAEVPLGAIENRIEGHPFSLKKTLLGRGLGTGLGLLTAPVAMRGIELSKSDNVSDRRKGTGLLLGAGAGYTALKGGIESAVEVGNKHHALARVAGRLATKPLLGLTIGKLVAKDDGSITSGAKSTALAGAAGALGLGVDRLMDAHHSGEGILRSLRNPEFRGGKLRNAALGGMVSGVAGYHLLRAVNRYFDGKKSHRAGE